MSVSLRRMRWWDVPEVRAIERALFPKDPWSAEQFWQELAQPSRSYVVAEESGRIVGYAGSFVMAPDADVQTVGVAGDAQGRGVASALLTSLIDDAAHRGATHMLLEVRADNDPARHLYARFGFAQISRRPRYYPDGVDAVIMRRALSSAARTSS
jgi:[ribosomal protein S18]-alanine N-acetyltransferase